MSEPREYLSSLRGGTCPACSRVKSPFKSFCGKCYRALPPVKQFALYALIGDGYEAAFDDALATLKANPAPAGQRRLFDGDEGPAS